ncbi:MAG: hypothetical protein JWM33_2441 [Caulobacteraceae bacterium]|nr:hypothetical protein [Caulobacteraceae bacterium]
MWFWLWLLQQRVTLCQRRVVEIQRLGAHGAHRPLASFGIGLSLNWRQVSRGLHLQPEGLDLVVVVVCLPESCRPAGWYCCFSRSWRSRRASNLRGDHSGFFAEIHQSGARVRSGPPTRRVRSGCGCGLSAEKLAAARAVLWYFKDLRFSAAQAPLALLGRLRRGAPRSAVTATPAPTGSPHTRLEPRRPGRTAGIRFAGTGRPAPVWARSRGAAPERRAPIQTHKPSRSSPH